MEIYLDLVIILNFCVDFLLILGTNRLCGFPPGWGRTALAAALGGAYAGVCVLPGLSFLNSTLWRIVFLGLMGVLAFGWNIGALRRIVLFIFMSMALGGIALGIGSGGFWAVVMAAIGVALLCLIGFQGRVSDNRFVPIAVRHGGKSISLTALVDTGNTLRDPISGAPVVVADAKAGEVLLSLSKEQLSHPVETIAQVAGLRLIPYHAVGQPAGLLLGIKAECVEINGKRTDCMVAFAPQSIGTGRDYQALTGGLTG